MLSAPAAPAAGVLLIEGGSAVGGGGACPLPRGGAASFSSTARWAVRDAATGGVASPTGLRRSLPPQRVGGWATMRRHPETVRKYGVQGRMSRRISPLRRTAFPHPEAKPSGSHRPTSVHIYEGIRSPLAGLGMRPPSPPRDSSGIAIRLRITIRLRMTRGHSVPLALILIPRRSRADLIDPRASILTRGSARPLRGSE